MKRYMGSVILGLMIGGLFTFYFLKVNNQTNEIYALEVLNTKDLELANNKSREYTSSMVLENDDGFHVILAIYNNIDLINKMLVYYEENNIDVHISKLDCSNEFLNKLNKYEDIVVNIENKDVYEDINKNILSMYKDTL